MKIHLEMDLDVKDGSELEISKLETHVDWLLDLDSWPEIQRVYNVKARLDETPKQTNPPSQKQREFAETISRALSIDPPKDFSKRAYWDFIKQHKDEYTTLIASCRYRTISRGKHREIYSGKRRAYDNSPGDAYSIGGSDSGVSIFDMGIFPWGDS